MGILFSTEILNAIYAELSSAQKSVQIISAFCKLDALKVLEAHIKPSVFDKKIMIRFRLSDLISGATDFEMLEHCLSNRWKVFIRFDLHAKTYIIDNSRGIVGSANMTLSGFDMNSFGNYEMASFVKIEKEDVEKINNLFANSIVVTQDIINLMKRQYESIKMENVSCEHLEWNDGIQKLFNQKITTLFSYDLPDTDKLDYAVGERIEFLDIVNSGDLEQVKNAFLFSNCYRWLVSTLKENGGCLFFGELSQKLHSSIVSDPKPYRKDVKQLLANLLSWIQILNVSDVIVDRPNHSQRIRLV